MDEPVADKPTTWKIWFLDKLGAVAFQVVWYGSGGLLFIAFGTLFFQVLKFLKTGEWPDWVLFTVLAEAFPDAFMNWVLHPKDWLGLHQIVVWIGLKCPIALIAFLLAGVWFIFGLKFLVWLEDITDTVKATNS